VYPYVVSAYSNGIYGLVIMLVFFLALTLGFAFELGKNALKIDSRQTLSLDNHKTSILAHMSSN
jgi:NADH-ubiquinone oxidoreductase chain 3